MKLKPKKSSTQPQIFESPHQQAMLTEPIPRDRLCTAVLYAQADGTFLSAFSPKPPTAEAIAKAQFVDKTYTWAGK